MRIVVVGAGLGGLATAIALASSGHTVTVYEQAPELGEVRSHPPVSAKHAQLTRK
jgi:salicylate hydroxylase